MARERANLTSRSRGADGWDAGLHAESEQGPIDVGLAVDPRALGVMIDAPGFGVVKVALEVADDGRTHLAQATRRLADGSEAAIAIDETRAIRLEGQMLELVSKVQILTSERDEARERAAAALEDRQSFGEHVAERETQASIQHERLVAQLDLERGQRLSAFAEREKAKAELERAKEQLDAGLATLMRELTLAQRAKDSAEADRLRLSQELSEVSLRLTARGNEIAALEAARDRSAVDQKATTAELAHRQQQLEVTEQEAKAASGALESAKERIKTLEIRVTEAERAAEAAAQGAITTADELARAQAHASALETEKSALDAHAAALDAEKVALEGQQAGLEKKVKAVEAELLGLQKRHDALVAAQTGAASARGELQRLLDEAQGSSKGLETTLAEERQATEEAREIARKLKLQLD